MSSRLRRKYPENKYDIIVTGESISLFLEEARSGNVTRDLNIFHHNGSRLNDVLIAKQEYSKNLQVNCQYLCSNVGDITGHKGFHDASREQNIVLYPSKWSSNDNLTLYAADLKYELLKKVDALSGSPSTSPHSRLKMEDAILTLRRLAKRHQFEPLSREDLEISYGVSHTWKEENLQALAREYYFKYAPEHGRAFAFYNCL